jgi:hypothetical protein
VCSLHLAWAQATALHVFAGCLNQTVMISFMILSVEARLSKAWRSQWAWLRALASFCCATLGRSHALGAWRRALWYKTVSALGREDSMAAQLICLPGIHPTQRVFVRRQIENRYAKFES